MTTATVTTTQVHKIWIKAPAEKIWAAITQPEWTARYGFGGYANFDLRPGGRYAVQPSAEFRAGAEAKGHPGLPADIITGEVVEADPPRRLVHTFHMHMDPTTEAEPVTRVTYEIADKGDGVCSLTLIHELEGAPHLAQVVGGGWEDQGAGGGHAWVLSDLKSLLETGSRLAG